MTDHWAGTIRDARPDEYAALLVIEVEADAAFAEIGVVLPPDDVGVEVFASAAVILVAGDPPVGVARIDWLDGLPHLEQLSVQPAAARRGVGSALLEATVDWAGQAGFPSISLITFRDVPFNAPFYRRRGFAPVLELSPGLARLRRHEQAIGLDAVGARIVLTRPTG